MSRRSLVVVVSLGLVIAMAWLVQVLGQSYRDSLLDRQTALAQRLIASTDELPKAGEKEIDSSRLDLYEVPADLNRVYEPVSSPRVETRKPASKPAEPVASTTSTTDSKSSTKPSAEKPATPPAIARIDLPKDLVAMSWAEEERIAGLLDRYILARHLLDDTPAYRKRVNEAKRVLKPSKQRKEITDYEVRILKSPRIFAFSHLGKSIYLSTGLFLLMANDVELQFVLAREMAHLDAKDFARKIHQETASPESAEVDPLTKLYRAIADGLPPDAEFQADSWAYRQLIRNGQSPHKALGFLTRFVEYIEQASPTSKPNIEANGTIPERRVEDRWLRLPSPDERLDRLKAPDLSKPR